MKDRYILVVVFAVVCTVWKVAESQDCNNHEELKECLSPIQALTDKVDFGFAIAKEGPDRMCRNLNRGLQCIDSYTRRCIAEEERHHFQSLNHNFTQVIQKICRPGPYQEEFLIHAPCLRQLNDQHEHCSRTYQQNIEEVHEKMEERDRRPTDEMPPENYSDLLTVCCSFREYLVCVHMAVKEKCGEQAAKFTDDFMNEISSFLMQAHCESSDQCQGSSASRNSPRALLFPVSLAMILSYAVRPT